jgi:hypothetical protein
MRSSGGEAKQLMQRIRRANLEHATTKAHVARTRTFAFGIEAGAADAVPERLREVALPDPGRPDDARCRAARLDGTNASSETTASLGRAPTSSAEDEFFIATGPALFHGRGSAVGRKSASTASCIFEPYSPQTPVVPIGWVVVGDPVEILPPDQHERILDDPEAAQLL